MVREYCVSVKTCHTLGLSMLWSCLFCFVCGLIVSILCFGESMPHASFLGVVSFFVCLFDGMFVSIVFR
jgi:hypothetical protein